VMMEMLSGEHVGLSKPAIVLVVDLELMWGLRQERKDSKHMAALLSDANCGRGVVRSIEDILTSQDVRATWAVVGHLFLDECDEGCPAHSPSERRDVVGDHFPRKIQDAPLLFGRDIVEEVISLQPHQEIAAHSFSHLDFSHCSRQTATLEIAECVRAARRLGINLVSFVFPYNAVGHLDVLSENGFRIARGDAACHRAKGLVNYVLKAIPPPGKAHRRKAIWVLEGSMLFTNQQQIGLPHVRALLGSTRVLLVGGILVLTLHPYNFLSERGLLGKFAQTVRHIARMRDRGLVQILTMADLAAALGP